MRELYFDNYSVIILDRNGMHEYYLAKNGYGDLYYILGSVEEIDIATIVDDYIDAAENECFWGDEE
jgi:hypothetical protein